VILACEDLLVRKGRPKRGFVQEEGPWGAGGRGSKRGAIKEALR